MIANPTYQNKWNEIYDEVSRALPEEAGFNLKWNITWAVYKKYMDYMDTIIKSIPHTPSAFNMENIFSECQVLVDYSDTLGD